MSDAPRPKSDPLSQTLREELKVHIRLLDQQLAPDPESIQTLIESLPKLKPFTHKSFGHITAILDWDHQLPSRCAVLRIYTFYERHPSRAFRSRIDERETEIRETNLYPEFDLPDYEGLESDETYEGIVDLASWQIDELRFTSSWRNEIPEALVNRSVKTVRESEAFQEALSTRANKALGGPIIVGWAPPWAAETTHWAIEICVLLSVMGNVGRARFFTVDSEDDSIGQVFDTDIPLG